MCTSRDSDGDGVQDCTDTLADIGMLRQTLGATGTMRYFAYSADGSAAVGALDCALSALPPGVAQLRVDSQCRVSAPLIDCCSRVGRRHSEQRANAKVQRGARRDRRRQLGDAARRALGRCVRGRQRDARRRRQLGRHALSGHVCGARQRLALQRATGGAAVVGCGQHNLGVAVRQNDALFALCADRGARRGGVAGTHHCAARHHHRATTNARACAAVT